MCYLLIDLSPLISQLSIVDDRHGDNPTTPNPPLQEECNFKDSSGPFFDIYSKAAEEEDNKRAEHWQKDAEGIIIFVSPSVGVHPSLHINCNVSDRSILCRSRCPACCYRTGPEAKQSGYLVILPWQHLSGPGRPEHNTLIHTFPCRKTATILSSEICRLGEYSLVLELGDEPQLCFVGDIVTTVGASISPSGSASPLQSRKASANACILCGGRGQDAHSVGS